MKPPIVARMLLQAVASESEAEIVTGDLHEEFLHLVARNGLRAGRLWYWRQVLRSVFPLWSLRVRHGEASHLVASAGLGMALLLLLLDRLWSFVYSLIPLKDGLDRAPGFLAVSLICASVLSAAGGAAAGNFRRALAVAAATMGAAVFAVWCSVGAAPVLYVALVLLAAPASTLAAYQWNRTRSKRRLQ